MHLHSTHLTLLLSNPSIHGMWWMHYGYNSVQRSGTKQNLLSWMVSIGWPITNTRRVIVLKDADIILKGYKLLLIVSGNNRHQDSLCFYFLLAELSITYMYVKGQVRALITFFFQFSKSVVSDLQRVRWWSPEHGQCVDGDRGHELPWWRRNLSWCTRIRGECIISFFPFKDILTWWSKTTKFKFYYCKYTLAFFHMYCLVVYVMLRIVVQC